MRTKEERQEAINRIVVDAGTCYDYEDFAADCVRKEVEKWNDEELDTWFGIEESD